MKARDGLMDVKHLEQVDADGLELWKPVLKAPLPVDEAAARTVLDALRVTAPLERGSSGVTDLAVPGVQVLDVHKTRRHFTIGGAMAELTDLRAGGRAIRTIAIESEEPARVLAAVRELGLAARANTNMPRGLKALAGPAASPLMSGSRDDD